MSTSCGSCVCSRPARTCTGGRLVLATQVDHTATALRSLALRRGTPLRVLGPGLLELRGEGLDAFVERARRDLSSVEAAEVRCLITDGALPDSALLAQALSAPSLSAAGARVQHRDLLPLFEDEHAAFHSVYQPIVSLETGRTVAHEALLRATDAERPARPPRRALPGSGGGRLDARARPHRPHDRAAPRRPVARRGPAVHQLRADLHLPTRGLPAHDREGRPRRRALPRPAGLRGHRGAPGARPRPPRRRLRLLPPARLPRRHRRPRRRLLVAQHAGPPPAGLRQAGQGDRAGPARPGERCRGLGHRRDHPRVRRRGPGRVRRDRGAGARGAGARRRPRRRAGTSAVRCGPTSRAARRRRSSSPPGRTPPWPSWAGPSPSPTSTRCCSARSPPAPAASCSST